DREPRSGQSMREYAAPSFLPSVGPALARREAATCTTTPPYDTAPTWRQFSLLSRVSAVSASDKYAESPSELRDPDRAARQACPDGTLETFAPSTGRCL